jgi:Lrp/AsnC family leucine-responsive transcriptional regulator
MTLRQLGGRPADEIDRRIIELLEEDARRSYGFIGRQVFLSPSAVKRRVDGLKGSKALLGFTALIEDEGPIEGVEAIVFLSLRSGVARDTFVASLLRHPEIAQAWMVSGDSDAVARVRAADTDALDRLTEDLKREGLIERLRSEMVLGGARRVGRRPAASAADVPASALLGS